MVLKYCNKVLEYECKELYLHDFINHYASAERKQTQVRNTDLKTSLRTLRPEQALFELSGRYQTDCNSQTRK